MRLKPEIEVQITVLPADTNSRKTLLRDDIVGYYACPVILPSGSWDCRMIFPNAPGHVDFGETTTALIQFLSPDLVLPFLRPGDTFQLWELGIVATGTVTKIISVNCSN